MTTVRDLLNDMLLEFVEKMTEDNPMPTKHIVGDLVDEYIEIINERIVG